ncbi:unnamed protein product, partial [Sphagnum compactum]
MKVHHYGLPWMLDFNNKRRVHPLRSKLSQEGATIILILTMTSQNQSKDVEA